MEHILEILMQVILVIGLTWTAVMFAKCMHMATYHPEVMDKKAENKE